MPPTSFVYMWGPCLVAHPGDFLERHTVRKGAVGAVLLATRIHQLSVLVQFPVVAESDQASITCGRTYRVTRAAAPVHALRYLVLAQLFQGKASEAVDTCTQAVDLCERHDDHTPDTEALGQVGGGWSWELLCPLPCAIPLLR